MKRTVTDAMSYTEEPVAGPWDGHGGNYDESRSTIDHIIIHTMVGTAEAASARFNNPTSNVSAHYGVKLDGSLIHWLEEYYTAYHAGDYDMNQRSIGIEHEDNGDYNGARPGTLYETSAKLVADICKFYSIPCDRGHIKKHNEVSDHPTACPDALDIDRIVREAKAILSPPTPTPPPDPCVITAQTKIPASLLTTPDYPITSDMEVQAIRSNIHDLNKELVACLNKPPVTPPNAPKTILGKYFLKLSIKFG